MRQRGERIERSFAHLYDTGGMRRTHLRGHTNILKRLLIHAGGFNLGLVMHRLIGSGTPRGLQGRPATVIDPLLVFLSAPQSWLAAIFRIAPTHSRCALVSLTHHHHRQLLAATLTPRVAKGKLIGFWAVSVSGHWPVIFDFDGNNVTDVNYLDYH
jgi:hypothetical protein